MGSAKSSKLHKLKFYKKEHIVILFSLFKIFKFNDIHTLNILIFIQKYCNNKLPPSFENMFTTLMDSNRTKSYKLEKVVNIYKIFHLSCFLGYETK